MENLEATLARLEAGKSWFAQLWAEEDVSRPLGEDEWSIAQHVEHLVLVERSVFIPLARSKDPLPPRTADDDGRRRLVSTMLRRAVKVPVPTEEVEPGAAPDPQALIAEWEKLRAKFRARLEGKAPAPDILVFVHPVAGALNGEESLEFLADHLQYHQKRVGQLLGR